MGRERREKGEKGRELTERGEEPGVVREREKKYMGRERREKGKREES
jgi:hypothetical protein